MTRESDWVRQFRPESAPRPHEEVRGRGWTRLGLWLTMLGMTCFMGGIALLHFGWAFHMTIGKETEIESYSWLIVPGVAGHFLGVLLIPIGAIACCFGPKRQGGLAPAMLSAILPAVAAGMLIYGLMVAKMLGPVGVGRALEALSMFLIGECLIWLSLAVILVHVRNVAASLNQPRLASSIKTFIFFWLLSPLVGYALFILTSKFIIEREQPSGSGDEIIAGGIGILMLIDVVWFVCVVIETVRAIPKRGERARPVLGL